MSAQAVQSAKHYARMICKHMKELPDHYADDPQDVQTALGLTDLEFNLGLDLCIQRGVIQIDKKGAPNRVGDEDATLAASPFAMGTPGTDEDETQPAPSSDASPFSLNATDTGELPAADLAKVW